MNITNINQACNFYFNAFQKIKNGSNHEKALAALSIISYFTLIIPLCFAVVKTCSSLIGRVQKKDSSSSREKELANNILKKNQTTKLSDEEIRIHQSGEEGVIKLVLKDQAHTLMECIKELPANENNEKFKNVDFLSNLNQAINQFYNQKNANFSEPLTAYYFMVNENKSHENSQPPTIGEIFKETLDEKGEMKQFLEACNEELRNVQDNDPQEKQDLVLVHQQLAYTCQSIIKSLEKLRKETKSFPIYLDIINKLK